MMDPETDGGPCRTGKSVRCRARGKTLGGVRISLMTALGLAAIAIVTVWTSRIASESRPRIEQAGRESAFEALQFVAQQRAYPSRSIPSSGYEKAFNESSVLKKAESGDTWTSLGPHNISGRMLAVVFNPQNPNTVWAGSAGGGLWISHSGGVGENAWSYVSTGYPVLAVSSIAVSPADSNEIYIGTGEVYNPASADGGRAIRETRGVYGSGILKSEDGGTTWERSLDWSRSQQRGVQALRMNPENPRTVWAATTEGVFVTRDAGDTWQLTLGVTMATDVFIHPADTNIVFAALGNLGSIGMGIYRTRDGGTTWEKAAGGLPVYYLGKARLFISPAAPEYVFVSVGGGYGAPGTRETWLARSVNQGKSWEILSEEDYTINQGWFSHFVAVHPDNANVVYAGGIILYKSIDGGRTLLPVSTPNPNPGFSRSGGATVPPDYMHVDLHDFAFHPDDPEIIYFATDGGIFRTLDGAATYEYVSGGLQTAQFYAGISSATNDSLLILGGLQDNGIVIYNGTTSWHVGRYADGTYTAIDPLDNNLAYSATQYLFLVSSSDRGRNWNELNNDISPPGISTETTSFAAPFAQAQSQPDILYAGREIVYRSDSRGQDWMATNGGVPLDGNPLIALVVSVNNPDVVYAATAPVVRRSGLFRTADAGATWTDITSDLPDRFPADLALDPLDDETAYVVFSGFGTSHVFRTADSGAHWEDIGSGLPDVPTSAVVVDPLAPNTIYVGNDLGIYVSGDRGQTWASMNEGLPDAVLVSDLNISPLNRKLRVATHGSGMFERPLVDPGTSPTSVEDSSDSGGIPGEGVGEGSRKTEGDAGERVLTLYQNYPNPFQRSTTIAFDLRRRGYVTLSVYDLAGRRVRTIHEGDLPAGRHSFDFVGDGLASGEYVYLLTTQTHSASMTMHVFR